MNNNQKLFVFDIDGTLLNDDKKISSLTKKSIETLLKNNHIVCLASGRTPIQTIDFVRELGLCHDIIGSDGGCIYSITDKKTKIISNPIPISDRKVLLWYAKQYHRELSFNDGISFWKCYFGGNLLEEIQDHFFFIGGSSKVPIYDDIKASIKFFLNPNHQIIQCSIKIESFKLSELIIKITPKLSDKVGYHCTSRVYYAVTPKGINKYNAIKLLQQKYWVNNHDTYCFGDSHNDLEMIKHSGNGIAMANATKELKKIAKYLTSSNNDEGIYKFLVKQKLI